MVFGSLAAEVLEFENDYGCREIISVMEQVAAN